MTVNPAVIVPIDVRAVALAAIDRNGNSISSGNARVDYSRFGMTGAGAANQPPISCAVDASASQGTAVSGIHIHWALPGALTTMTDWSSLMSGWTSPLLPAPDMWLVVRFNPTDTAAPSQMWVVESSYVADAPGSIEGLPSTTLPLDASTITESGQPRYQYMGRTTVAQSWPPSGTAQYLSPPLTAAGHGIGNFAGYYPDCPNVFGIADTGMLPSNATGPLSYLVIGWYRDPQSDPLASGITVGDVLTQLNWQIQGAAPSDPAPTRTIFAGMVSGVSAEPAPPPQASAVSMAVGASAPSALSALVTAMGPGKDPNAASDSRVLTAFQFGKLNYADQTDAAALIDDFVHAMSFQSASTSNLTTLQPQNSGIGASSNILLPDQLAQGLLSLNAQELTGAIQQDQADALLDQLMLDWQTYIKAVYGPAQPQDTIQQIMEGLVSPHLWKSITVETNGVSSTDILNAASAEASATAATITTLQAALSSIAQQNTPSRGLGSVQAPAWSTALDPSFAISSTALTAPDRIGGSMAASNTTPLPVRLQGDILSSLTVLDGASGQAQIDVGALATLVLPADLAPSDILPALILEAMLIDPLQAPTLANAASSNTISGLAGVLQQDLTAAYGTGSAAPNLVYGASGVSPAPVMPPSVGCVAWTAQPWIPVLLRWRATITPFQSQNNGAYLPTTVTGNFQLSTGDTDLLPVVSTAGAPYSLQGQGVLAPNTCNTLAALMQSNSAALESLLGEQEFNAVISDLKNQPIHVGAFADFFHQSKQLGRNPQIVPADPFHVSGNGAPSGTLSNGEYQAFTVAVNNTLTAASGILKSGLATFMPELPNAIVNGLVSITAIDVVDCFGQLMTLSVPDPLATDDMLAIPQGCPPANFYMPPRLAVPSRLRAQWVTPYSDANGPLLDNPSAPAVNPARGWLLYSTINEGILLFDAAGNSLALVLGGSEIFWMPTPGSTLNGVDPSATGLIDQLIIAEVDPVFQVFVSNLITAIGPSGSFASFVDLLEEIASTVAPSAATLDPSEVALMGRPLAVVQAAFALDIKGQPPVMQTLEALENYVAQLAKLNKKSFTAPSRDALALTEVQFPLLLGDDARQDDGLYGYFIDGAETPIFYYAGANATITGGFAAASPSCFAIAANGQTSTVTMLVDPGAPVHIASGVLPVATLTVPPSFYRTAYATMQFAMEIGPLLAPDPAVTSNLATIPPALSSGDWHWTSGGSTTTTIPVVQLNPATLATGAPPALQEGWMTIAIDFTQIHKGGK